MTAIVVAEHCSKWYGDVLGVANVSWQLAGGIVGVLGRNGAGKSTLIKLMSGLFAPSYGAVRVFGADPFGEPAVRRRIGYAPEHERTWGELTARELVAAMAELAGLARSHARAAAGRALAQVGLTDVGDRRVREFSNGMRQRVKLATAIAHEPDLLLLDEPLTGVDPIARRELVAQIRALAAAGKTIVVSSHVLSEIEALTSEVVILDRGQLLAEGNVGELRALLEHRPHRIRIDCDRPHALAAALAGGDHVARLIYEPAALIVETRDPDRCYDAVAQAVIAGGFTLARMAATDDNVGAVFEYLTGARATSAL